MTTPVLPGRSSPAENVRPRSALAPSTSNRFADVFVAVTRTASPAPSIVIVQPGEELATSDSTRARARRNSTSAFETNASGRTATSWSGRAYGSGSRRTARTTENTDAFAAAASETMKIASAENPGCRRRERTANRRSCSMNTKTGRGAGGWRGVAKPKLPGNQERAAARPREPAVSPEAALPDPRQGL